VQRDKIKNKMVIYFATSGRFFKIYYVAKELTTLKDTRNTILSINVSV